MAVHVVGGPCMVMISLSGSLGLGSAFLASFGAASSFHPVRSFSSRAFPLNSPDALRQQLVYQVLYNALKDFAEKEPSPLSNATSRKLVGPA
jgi:hypothetical protein